VNPYKNNCLKSTRELFFSILGNLNEIYIFSGISRCRVQPLPVEGGLLGLRSAAVYGRRHEGRDLLPHDPPGDGSNRRAEKEGHVQTGRGHRKVSNRRVLNVTPLNRLLPSGVVFPPTRLSSASFSAPGPSPPPQLAATRSLPSASSPAGTPSRRPPSSPRGRTPRH
jgi:hypothetical protein